MVKPMRFVLTFPGTIDVEGVALLAKHRELIGPENGDRTFQQQAHRDQMKSKRVGWNGAPVYEFICPECGIYWRR